MQGRLAAGRALLTDYDVASEVVWFADTMTDAFNNAYASWPFRFWVLGPSEPPPSGTSGGGGGGGWRVRLKPMPKDATYDLNELERHLAGLQPAASTYMYT